MSVDSKQTGASHTRVENLITEHMDIWTSAIKRKSSSGRGSSKKIDLYGIKKLRELILELAVRGKLVPQDPSDEPASVLLERIAQEKGQLVKDGKIKKPKTLPEIRDAEKPFELPQGWEWDRLGELGYTQTGGTPNKNKTEYFGAHIPFIKPGDILERKVDYSNEGLSLIGEESLGRSAPKGSILMVCIGTIGKCAYIDRKCAFNQQINSITPYLEITDFLIKALSASYFQNLSWSLSASTTIAIINKGKWESIPVVLPPLQEQHRIVAKVDELMALCDELEAQTESSLDAHQTLVTVLLDTLVNSQNADELTENWTRLSAHFDTLFVTEDSIDQLKQSILQLAVMGKLVSQDPNDEPASVLLERIAAEKAQLIKDKKIKKQKPLPPINDDEKPFELPTGWEWVRFGNVVICRLGKMLDKAKNTGSLLPYLRNTNVQWDRFILDDIKLMKLEESELQEFRILPGDLLICEGGEPGRCAIWIEAELEMYFQKALHRARPLAGVQSKYLQLCLTVDAKTGVLDNYFTGATIKHFVGAKLNNYIHSLPPLEEQYRIVAKVDELMALCDQLKAQLTSIKQTQLHLADTLVAQAL
ncbi:restriction endonuclease subunit S [Marinomonas balearica]|uniref:Type I restriction enzyme S subunit n=1 Tax=Marinomonas balearica TaxID=491947 RepID=A0A4V3CGY9_9GAMM|nr:restriction endonuclease subunit S [Marinomonas balearica]TDO99582.1 type I restriction enzyme S subunit [Marinomonas balearica]